MWFIWIKILSLAVYLLSCNTTGPEADHSSSVQLSELLLLGLVELLLSLLEPEPRRRYSANRFLRWMFSTMHSASAKTMADEMACKW